MCACTRISTTAVAGRVGDTPIAGAGCYVEEGVGGAGGTGDGDVMMRFLPALRATMVCVGVWVCVRARVIV